MIMASDESAIFQPYCGENKFKRQAVKAFWHDESILNQEINDEMTTDINIVQNAMAPCVRSLGLNLLPGVSKLIAN